MNLDRLRQLEAAASPGPWSYGAIDHISQYKAVYRGRTDKFSPIIVAMLPMLSEGAEDRDGQLIAELRNAAQALLDRLSRMEAMLRKHQWAGVYDDTDECPECHREEGHSHAPDCELACLLK